MLDPAPSLMTYAAAGITAAPEASTGEGGSTPVEGAVLSLPEDAPVPDAHQIPAVDHASAALPATSSNPSSEHEPDGT